jgi:hypothetical protein
MRKRTLIDLDQDPEAALTEWRQAVGELVHSRIEKYAKVIGGFRNSDGSQFEKHVVDALLWCSFTHLDFPNRKRQGKTRKELLRVAKEATAAKKHLERLRDALGELDSVYRERLDGRLDLLSKIAVSFVEKQPPWFNALSTVSYAASIYAEVLRGKDKGGVPKMVAFNALIAGLKRAFESAKGRPAKVTRNQYREQFGGKFLALVEAVLPLALVVAGGSQGQMPHPISKEARGKYVYEATRRKRKRTGVAIP